MGIRLGPATAWPPIVVWERQLRSDVCGLVSDEFGCLLRVWLLGAWPHMIWVLSVWSLAQMLQIRTSLLIACRRRGAWMGLGVLVDW